MNKWMICWEFSTPIFLVKIPTWWPWPFAGQVASMVMEATAESMEAMATIIGQVADLGPMSNTTPSRCWEGIKGEGSRRRFHWWEIFGWCKHWNMFFFWCILNIFQCLLCFHFWFMVHSSHLIISSLRSGRMATSLLGQILNSGTGTSAFNDQRVATSILSKKPKWMGVNRLAGWESCWAYMLAFRMKPPICSKKTHSCRYGCFQK